MDPRYTDRRMAYQQVRPTSQSYIQQVGYHAPNSMGQMSVDDVYCPPPSASYCPPQHLPTAPRVGLPIVAGVERPATSAELYPDEYICDGGDEGLKTRIENDGSVVLQFEETVATFVDEEAVAHVEPTTRVCIYAPTFGAVRTISRPVVDLAIDKVAGTHDKLAASGYEAPLVPSIGEQVDAGMQTRVRSRVSEVDVERIDANVGGVIGTSKHVKLINAFQDYGSVGDYEMFADTIAVLREGVASAVAWESDRTPVVVARDENLLQVTASAVSQEYFLYEDKREDGQLRLIKTADVRTAKKGDKVQFVIRFDNTGGKPLFDVTVVDHLSPRLEVDRDSVACDRDADVFFDDDQQGSLYLKVRINEPLDANDGGLVQFTCTVK